MPTLQLVRMHAMATGLANGSIQMLQPQLAKAVVMRNRRVMISMVGVIRFKPLNSAFPLTVRFNPHYKSTLKDNAYVTVGENSCVGYYSCHDFKHGATASIGNDSCNAEYSCIEWKGWCRCSKLLCKCSSFLIVLIQFTSQTNSRR
jgi:hypothetical protein